MIRFYAYWRVEQLEPVEALRQAQHWLRDTTNGEKVAYFEKFLKSAVGDPAASTGADIPTGVAKAFCTILRTKNPQIRD